MPGVARPAMAFLLRFGLRCGVLAAWGCGGSPDGAAVGARLPALPLGAVQATPWSAGPVALVFWRLDCRPCLVARAAAVGAPLPATVALLPVHVGTPTAGDDIGWPEVGGAAGGVVGPASALAALVEIDALPLFVIVDAEGVVRSRAASWPEARAAALALDGEDGG